MLSPTVPLSVRERGDRRGDGRRGVDRHRQRRRGRAGVAGGIDRLRRQAVAAVRQRRGGVAPGPAAVRRRACPAASRRQAPAPSRWPRRAGQRQRVVVGDAVAHRAAVGRERADGRGGRRHGVDRARQRRRGRAGVAGGIDRRRRQAVAAVRQRRRGVAPGPAAVRRRRAQQRRAVKHLAPSRWPPPCRSASACCRW